jgi:succinyl-CoA synthetase alpha subunit
MSILINGEERVIVQGITGREGRARALLMKEYGTNIIAGVTPGKGGDTVEGIPVYDTVEHAWEEQGPIDISVLFIPAPLVKSAAIESIEAGVRLLVIVPDRVPIYDVLAIACAAKKHGASFIGPNTLGVLSPDKGVLGMIGGRAASAKSWFFPGPLGITSRSGGITSSMAYYLAREGMGASTLVHVGGDVVVGLPHPRVVRLFEADPETKAIVMFGEIGGSQEEEVAGLIERGEVTKPLIAFIGGKAAKSGTRFSHAGAIIEGSRGTYEGKVKCLREAGATVVENFGELPKVTKQVLIENGVIA